MPIDFSKYDKNEWLKGSDLANMVDEGERLPVTVSKAYEHQYPSGDEAIVLELLEIDQKLSLNKSRRDKMRALFGDDETQWVGKQITLYTTDVAFQGKQSIGIAIAAMPRKKAPQPVVEDDLDGDVIFRTGRN